MTDNVYQIHTAVKPECVYSGIGFMPMVRDTLCMANRFGKTYLRKWRQHRAKTLVQVSELLHMTHGQLSRIERGEQPYNQALLETLADLYACAVPDLLMRDPSEPTNIWSLWDRAKPGERRVIQATVEAILKTGTEG